MNIQQARTVFDQAAAEALRQGDADRASRLELAREYFTNPEFKKALESFVWSINSKVVK